MAFRILLPSFFAILLSQLAFAHNSTVLFNSVHSLSWTNADSSTAIRTYMFPDNLLFRVLLLARGNPEAYGNSLIFGLGFYCARRLTKSCWLSLLLLECSTDGVVLAERYPQVVWTANNYNHVEENAVLHADRGRGLVLTNTNGFDVFSTKLSGNFAEGMTLKEDGELVLFDITNSTIWRSSDFPTDTLLVGQGLREGSKLTTLSSINVVFSLSIRSTSLTAFVDDLKPVAYLSLKPDGAISNSSTLIQVIFTPTNITFTYKLGDRSHNLYKPTGGMLSQIQLLRLGKDGGLRIYVWKAHSGWTGTSLYDQCQIPMACGKYGVCTQGGHCACPKSDDGVDYLTPVVPTKPKLGCNFNLTSYKKKYVLGVLFGNLSYFSYYDQTTAVAGINGLEACTFECSRDFSCSAVFFTYDDNTSDGHCYMASEVLTIRAVRIEGDLKRSVAYLKTPAAIYPPYSKATRKGSSNSFSPSKIVKAVAITGSLSLCMLISFFIFRKIIAKGRQVKDCYEQVLVGPVRFSYRELCLATKRFCTKLGSGGSGSVFKGELKDGTVIAVKRLDSIEQGTGEFLAEMQTVGSLHHYNLVKLIGFCTDESNRLLVYEYMSNSSLDKWIFSDGPRPLLNWETRRRIILDVARGLAYLHEGCSQRIAHLDMKPHNILLDENFNAKISDFGLARFIDRNRSHVSTSTKGTLGYLAPEWQNSRISVKADIYSFGIVILEAVSGRLNLDYSQSDADVHFLGVLQRKADEDRLIDIVDKKIADSESHMQEIMQMIRIGVWCVNEDQSKRPRMSTVVKVLEGSVEMEHHIEFKFRNTMDFSSNPFGECSLKSALSVSL
ncbi:putative G-type lectin S-receptor-like serine/threonine-protein kinase SD2-5 [Iris pallida]|uniref:Receptor-like serine/threonine-protein kinase n=1 Tax=Iris pallida TaxID=29817 RepID=A0AAX6HP59_IRIPA|nr:putative G-type lectin S-receptor-like serine/threonine-protein kinase SD2-5 [Iris pallida]